ncbi:hypothetical protein KA405_00565 [Patescibacteria group bacterium]|nr:hypothetical protein [Patescibacteria group bacterium]
MKTILVIYYFTCLLVRQYQAWKQKKCISTGDGVVYKEISYTSAEYGRRIRHTSYRVENGYRGIVYTPLAMFLQSFLWAFATVFQFIFSIIKWVRETGSQLIFLFSKQMSWFINGFHYSVIRTEKNAEWPE